MAVSQRVWSFLSDHMVSFQSVHHLYSETMWEGAITAEIPPSNIAKAVLLKDPDNNFILAVIPAKRRLDIKAVNEMLDVDCVLAKEQEVFNLFEDCAQGAIPAMGKAYGIETVWDSHLNQCRHVYFEAGDHATLLAITHEDFERLFIDLPHDDISVPMQRKPSLSLL